jgi:hypothetical protein
MVARVPRPGEGFDSLPPRSKIIQMKGKTMIATDPFRGMTYSQILDSLSAENRRKYTERPHKLNRRIPCGVTVWDASIGRHATV